MNVVVIDDAVFMRQVLKDVLKGLGYTVIGEGGNGLEAINLVRQLKPDVITLDITMPDMSGIEAIPSIINENKDTKIVMVSAMGQETMIKECIRLGAKDFIVKPFQKERVQMAFDRL